MLHTLSKLESYSPRRLDEREREVGLLEIQQICKDLGYCFSEAHFLRATAKSTVARVYYKDETEARKHVILKIYREQEKFENELFCLSQLSQNDLAPRIFNIGIDHLLLEDLDPHFYSIDSLTVDSVAEINVQEILALLFESLGKAHMVMAQSFPPEVSVENLAPDPIKKWWGDEHLPLRFGDLKLSHCFFSPSQGVRFIDFETFELGFCGLNDVYQLMVDLKAVCLLDDHLMTYLCSSYDKGRGLKEAYFLSEYRELINCFERSFTHESPGL